jgi:uncharacterized damage-inducible protein DinB
MKGSLKIARFLKSPGKQLYSFAGKYSIMKDQLLSTIENSRKYTLQVAEAMPDKDYHYKPAGAGWDFGELLHHIAYGIYWWQDNYITGNKTDWNPPPAKNKKQEIITYLTQAYDDLLKTIKKVSFTEQAVNGVHATLDHITHHRGQAVIYLRTNGVEPPEYVY